MVDVANTLKDQSLKSRLLLQVHDELIFEVPESELETMKQLVSDLMSQTISLDVPLVVDVEFGKTWYEAK